MNVIEVPESGKRVEYPSAWEEMNAGQLVFVMRQALLLMAGEVGLLDFKVIVFYHLAGIRRKQVHNRKEELLTKEQQARKYYNVARAAETIGFMFRNRDGKTIFEFDCVKNLLPEIEVGKDTLYGPAEALFNVTFGEYRVAYDYFRKFLADRDEKALNGLCAVLYRPKRRDDVEDDIRIDFNPHECARRATVFEGVPFEVKFAVSSWFSACDSYFKTGELEVDGKVISLAPLFKLEKNEESAAEEEDGNLGLTGILMGIADSGTFGTMADVERTNLYTVMLKLYLWHKESERIKKLYKNDKSE